ncbi:unnamed protein product [Diabrotica balteata]|uniref:Chorion peroxidase n=1 Tax=Diabrotica balteata TaxID=107213 RepID=A0A9N9SS45_DIABA|nr:unnamed protein product [Diabrotica balteata]
MNLISERRMNQPTERTRLLIPVTLQPEYPFNSSISRERKKRVKQFQCCLCAMFLSIFLITIVITVIYSINEEDKNNSTSSVNESNTSIETIETPVISLFSAIVPLEDANKEKKTLNNVELWNEAIEEGKKGLNQKDEIEKEVPSLNMQSPSYRHQRVTATHEKGRLLNKTDNQPVEVICENALISTNKLCENTRIECNKFHKYRSFNGSCNNLKKPQEYGVAFRRFRRMLPPDYADDHDITATALSQKANGSTISCCDYNVFTSPECFPVRLDEEDPFREYNVSCIEFVRSAPAPTCCLGSREQLNQVTSFIDGSVIYSADEDFAKKLRDSTKGDARANENLHLTTMHLLWVRQHNRIAENLSKINTHWDDETIFQETRRIVAAQIQHITYNEFLPILLGHNLMRKYDLLPLKWGYSKKYNDSLNPDIANNFATAAFRFAHSIIPGLMKLLANDTSSPEYVQMHKMLFNPFGLYKLGEMDRTLKGAMNTTIEASDSYFTNESGRPLPSSRTVSLIVHRPYYRDDPKFSVMLAVWGQFLDHDITATALSQKANGSTISCCDYNVFTSPSVFQCDWMKKILLGDARANENLHLTTMHLLWVRQHNRIAENLSKINTHWDDETIFQETRRIVAAQIQHITYNEFLPIFIRLVKIFQVTILMRKYDLLPLKWGYSKKYNDSLNPDIANNFATAAFRFAHSIIPGLMKLLANDTSSPEYVQMHKMLFNPFGLYKLGEMDRTLKGAMNTTIEASDSYFTNELKSHMFERTVEQLKQPKLCGLDLVSLNVQRGRDHGLPGYTKWRKLCGLKNMVRTYIRKTQNGAGFSYSTEDLNMAIEDIRNGIKTRVKGTCGAELTSKKVTVVEFSHICRLLREEKLQIE